MTDSCSCRSAITVAIDGGRGEQPAQQRRQLVEHAQVQPGAVPAAAGEQEQPQQRHREVGAPLLRRPQHGRGQQHGVDRQHEHPRPHPGEHAARPARARPACPARRGAGTDVPSVIRRCGPVRCRGRRAGVRRESRVVDEVDGSTEVMVPSEHVRLRGCGTRYRSWCGAASERPLGLRRYYRTRPALPQVEPLPGRAGRMRDTAFERQMTRCAVLQGRGAGAASLRRTRCNRFTMGSGAITMPVAS